MPVAGPRRLEVRDEPGVRGQRRALDSRSSASRPADQAAGRGQGGARRPARVTASSEAIDAVDRVRPGGQVPVLASARCSAGAYSRS